MTIASDVDAAPPPDPATVDAPLAAAPAPWTYLWGLLPHRGDEYDHAPTAVSLCMLVLLAITLAGAVLILLGPLGVLLTPLLPVLIMTWVWRT